METLDALHPHNAGERRTLADIIFAKLDGQQEGPAGTHSVAQIQKVRQGTQPSGGPGDWRRCSSTFQLIAVLQIPRLG